MSLQETTDMAPRPIMHIDIPTADREATGTFYSELFGWTIQHEPAFTWFSTGSVHGGFPDLNVNVGLRPVVEAFKPGDVVLYIPSTDIDADLRRVEALGGTVLVPKTQAGEGHWVALFADPNGARLGLSSGNG
jgi:predicted enzyme related to lactoylglutathione lyase